MTQPSMLQREISRNAPVFWGVTWGPMHLKNLHSVQNSSLMQTWTWSLLLCAVVKHCRGCVCSHPIPAGLYPIFSCTHSWANDPCAHEGAFARPFLAAAQGLRGRFQPGQLSLQANVTPVTPSSHPCSRNVPALGTPELCLVTPVAFYLHLKTISHSTAAPISSPINISLQLDHRDNGGDQLTNDWWPVGINLPTSTDWLGNWLPASQIWNKDRKDLHQCYFNF